MSEILLSVLADAVGALLVTLLVTAVTRAGAAARG